MTDRSSLRVGATLSTVGAEAARLSVVRDAQAAERAGFDTVWAFDHVLMPVSRQSPYPFTDTGDVGWQLDDPWFDTLTWITAAAVATTRVEVGTNVLLAALRHPLALAKQLATIDQLAGGRLTLGVGAGWLLEEFEALGVPPTERGRRLDATLDLLRHAWSGELRPEDGGLIDLRQPVHVRPRPAHQIPFLIGGTSAAALRRVARLGAGWIAEATPAQDPVALIATGVRRIHELAEESGTPYSAPLRVVYNANETLEALHARLDELVACGVTDVAVSVNLEESPDIARAIDVIRGG